MSVTPRFTDGFRNMANYLSNLEEEKQTVLLFVEDGRNLYQNQRDLALFVSRD